MQIKVNNRDLRLDEEGNVLDAHDGTLEFFEGHFYWYGTTSDKTDNMLSQLVNVQRLPLRSFTNQ